MMFSFRVINKFFSFSLTRALNGYIRSMLIVHDVNTS